jgi:hypothetical protein
MRERVMGLRAVLAKLGLYEPIDDEVLECRCRVPLVLDETHQCHFCMRPRFPGHYVAYLQDRYLLEEEGTP